MPSLTTLSLRLRKGATKVLLTMAEIAEEYKWCHNLLESILQEIYTLFSDNRTCSILQDVVEQSSQDLLIAASVSQSFIKRQTSIRLILLASNQSSHIYYQSVAELLANTTDTIKSSYGIEAIIRLISGNNFSSEVNSLTPGVALALEQLLIDEFKMQNDNISRNLNVLQNLLFLVR